MAPSPKRPPAATPARVPTNEAADHGGCEVTELFRLLGKSHVMGILYYFLQESPGPHRFMDVQKRLALSPNTLTERLKELVDAGLLARTAYNEIPPRVDYEATKKAKELGEVFDTLVAWSQRNDLEPVARDAPASA